MLSLALLLFVLCVVYLWSKYGRLKFSSHALPPAAPGMLPVVGFIYQLLKSHADLYKLKEDLSQDCAKQGGVTYFSFGKELYYLIHNPEDSFTAANLCSQKHYAYSFMKPWIGDGLLTSSVGTFGIDAINDLELTRRYRKSIVEMLHVAFSRVIKFWQQSDLIYKLFGLQKKQDKVVEMLHAMSSTVLQKKKADVRDEALNKCMESESSGVDERTWNRYKSFLDLLLELLQNGTLTDKEVREELDTIIAAGFETTSNQMTYTLLQLGANPEVQEKVYQELIEILGEDRNVDKYDLKKLVYTNAVIMESLRTFPTVPALYRYVDKDVKLKNYTMRGGSHCVILPLATHLDSCWGPESDQFKPERWLNGDFRNNKEFAAFGLGKRACIGRTYAMISMKVTLAHFIRRYRVTADMSNLKMNVEFIMRPVSGHKISIERRL